MFGIISHWVRAVDLLNSDTTNQRWNRLTRRVDEQLVKSLSFDFCENLFGQREHQVEGFEHLDAILTFCSGASQFVKFAVQRRY